MNACLERTQAQTPRRGALYLAVLAALLLGWSTCALAQDEFSLDEPTKPPPDPEKVAELTQIQSTVEYGLGYVSDDSFRFGRYSGHESDGLFAILNVDWFWRAPHDSERTDYVRVTADDFGLSSREASFEYGHQGNFAVRVDYDQLVSFRSDSARTIFNGSGGNNLTLPTGWVGATSTAGMTALLPSLQSIELEQERRRLGLGLTKILGPAWTFSANFQNEDREGLKSIGGVFGNSGGNPRAALLPEPIDYQTRTFEAEASYHGNRAQLVLRYQLSLFDNANSALTWQNPFTAINGWQASAGFPTGQGSLALPPDNDAHQLSLSAGYDISSRMRLSADVAVGRMNQDDAFLPYTINPVLAATITQPLPRNSLDGQIDTTVANIQLSSRAGERLYWTAGVQYDDRDNQTPRSEYVYIGGDSQAQDVGATSSRRRFNEPYSYQQTRMHFDAGYRLGSSGRLSASLERRDIERTYSEREEADEDQLSLGYTRDLSDRFSIGLKFKHGNRDGSTYHGNEPFLSGYAPGYTSTVPGMFENAPGLRKFNLADRDRDQAALSASFTPSEFWSFSLEANRTKDDYSESSLGLTETGITTYTFDTAFMPTPDWTAYAFVARERLSYDQNGVSTRGATRVTDADDPARAWSAFHDDRVDSSGAGLTWKAIGDRLELGADFFYSLARGDVEVITGSALSALPLPSLTNKMESVGLTARYRLRSNLALNGGYHYESYRSTDWSVDGIEANQLANVILFGEDSPDYHVNVITLSLSYRF